MAEIPYGYCHCGCGQKTNLATKTNVKYGHVKGQPQRFVHGHHVNVRPRRPLIDRFWSKVLILDDINACWEWKTETFGRYPTIKLNRRVVQANRVAWEITNGAIPDGLFVLHECDNPRCCNPNHLFLGTHLENMEDMTKKGRRSKGEKHIRSAARGEQLPQHKLTVAQVEYIRRVYAEGNISQYQLAKQMGVRQGTISNIVCNKSWRIIKDDKSNG